MGRGQTRKSAEEFSIRVDPPSVSSQKGRDKSAQAESVTRRASGGSRIRLELPRTIERIPPSAGAGAPAPSVSHFRGWIWWLALLLAAGLVQAGASLAHADSIGTSTVTVVPADGQSRDIELRSQTVDVVISQDAEAVWADTEVWIRLYNPATRTITVPLALPGPQLTPGDLPADLLIRLDDVALPTEPTRPADGQGPAGLLSQIIIDGQQAVSLRLSYRQALPESGGLVTFAYPLSAADQWANTPESLRVTARFSAPVVAEQLLVQAPPAHSDGRSLTWQWEGVRALEDVGVAFLAPAWWAEFNAARAAAAAPDAPAAAHIALSRRYQQLAALAPSPLRDPLGDPIDFYTRYYPAAVAELQAAVAQAAAVEDANTSIADRLTAHASLASLYREQANRLGLGGIAYLELAVDEANAAMALGATDPNLRSLAADSYVRLAQISQLQGNTAAAERYAATLVALQGGTTPEEQARDLTLIAAAQASARGDLDRARQLLIEAVGSEAATLPGAPPPIARQALVSVTTTPGTRTITLTLADVQDTAGVGALLQRAADQLRAVTPATVTATVTAATTGLAINMPWQDAQELITAQTALADALPDDPELALLAAALSPARVTWRTADDLLRRSSSYVEFMDLEPARLIWLGLANRLEEASREESSARGSDDRLLELQRARWAADAAAWRALADRSRVEYRIDLGKPTAARAWQLAAGSARALAVEATDWSRPTIGWGAGAAGLLLILLALAVWETR